MAWTCVCENLEERAQIYHKTDPIASVAWAPLMARKVECIAVARGGMVRLLGLGGQLQGHINANENLQAYQVRVDRPKSVYHNDKCLDCTTLHVVKFTCMRECPALSET